MATWLWRSRGAAATLLPACQHPLSSLTVSKLRSLGIAPTACLHAGPETEGGAVASVRQAVRPGDTLALSFEGPISIHCGDHEEVQVQVSSHDTPSAAAAAGLKLSSGSCPDGYTRHAFSLTTNKPNGSGPWTVQAKAPARFVTLEVSSKGGDVFVESIKEASLQVESGGGGITVPSVKGDQVALLSGGGPIKGSVTAAHAELSTQGGPVQLKSLLAKWAEVDSGGGALSLGACYAEQAALRSGGAVVSIGTLQCNEGGRVESQGGDIRVDSLQGSAELASAGGDIQVHVQPDMHHLWLSSGGGGITLFLTPGMTSSLVLPSAAQLHIGEALQAVQRQQQEGEQQEQEEEGRGDAAGWVHWELEAADSSNGNSSGGAPLSRLQAAQTGGLRGSARPFIQVEPGSGQVTVRQLSWMEAMQRKLSGGGGLGRSSGGS